MAGRSPFLPFPLFLRDKKICEICEICVRLKLYICVKKTLSVRLYAMGNTLNLLDEMIDDPMENKP